MKRGSTKRQYRVAGKRTVTLPGRFGWAAEELRCAGGHGVTPIERPAPRWSHYVFILRRRHGLNIETKSEKHGGPYPGTHARYVLHDSLKPISSQAGQ